MDSDISSPAFTTTKPYPSPASVPFSWEERPGVPNPFFKFLEQDFAFDVSEEFSSDSIPAEDLFDGGVIKLQELKTGSSSSFSSVPRLAASKSRRTQSFSTHRGWECPWEEQEQETGRQQSPAAKNIKPHLVSSSSSLSASSSAKRSSKWSFRNMFLFRSASDGRAMDRDPLKKYSAIFRKHDEDLRNLSRRCVEPHSRGSGSGSNKRGRVVSAHELHYKVNRAVANDMKKQTFLPYKQGILGRLAFNPTVHALSNGFGFSHKNRE